MNNQEKPAFKNEISAEQERIITALEENMCPECNKDAGYLENRLYDGFCSEDCAKKYEENDPNLVNLKAAEGEFNYRYSLSQDAKELGMDVGEYRKMRENHLSFAEIRDQIKGKE